MKTACKGDPGKWQQLFNGKDLTGWKHVGPGGDTVEDGLIQTHGGMGLLYWTGGKIGNCEIHVVFKMRDENDNSGVFIRIPLEPREEWMPVHYGYEVQIDNHPEKSNEDEYHSTGMLYSLTKPLVKKRGSRARSGTRWTSPWTVPARSSCSMERRSPTTKMAIRCRSGSLISNHSADRGPNFG